MAYCKYHEDRPGIGICMRCRGVICASCCTRVEGINYCHACLRTLGRRAERPRSDQSGQGVLAVLVLGVAWVFFAGVLWLLQGSFAP